MKTRAQPPSTISAGTFARADSQTGWQNLLLALEGF